jgi:hypothetical protein
MSLSGIIQISRLLDASSINAMRLSKYFSDPSLDLLASQPENMQSETQRDAQNKATL